MQVYESKLGGLIGVGGLIVGLSFAIKKNKSFGVSALYALGFGAILSCSFGAFAPGTAIKAAGSTAEREIK